MENSNKKTLSPFMQAAETPDSDFSEMERLSGSLERLSVDSDSGLEQARKLLARFGDCSQRIAGGIQALAKSLDEARVRAEQAATAVSSRVVIVQKRQEESDQLLTRFQILGEVAGKLTVVLSQVQSPEQKGTLGEHLPEIDSKLGFLLDEARKLREDARAANMKTLERNAESLNQTLSAARRHLNAAAQLRAESASPHAASPNHR